MKTTINIEGKEFTIEQLKELIRCDQGDPVHLALQSGEELEKGQKDLKRQENKFTSNF